MLTKLIPGYNTATNIASATAGAVVGGGIASIISYVKGRSKEREIASLEEQLNELTERLGLVDEVVQERMILKVGILKQLAYADGELHDAEYKFIVNYILQSGDLQTDIKLILIENLNAPPPRLNKLFEPISKFFTAKENIFRSDEEKRGFISSLEALLNIDGKILNEEVSFMEKIKNVH